MQTAVSHWKNLILAELQQGLQMQCSQNFKGLKILKKGPEKGPIFQKKGTFKGPIIRKKGPCSFNINFDCRYRRIQSLA